MTDDEQIRLVVASTQNMVVQLHQIEGIPLSLVLAVMHGEVMAMIAAGYGGAQAAGMARRAADDVEGYPEMNDCKLATMQPQGRA